MPGRSRPQPPRWLAIVGAVTVLAAGMAIGWIDSRPTWDDTGVTAMALVIVAAGGSVAGVPAWLSTLLTVGPLLAAELSGNAGALLAVPFALVGATVGALVRRTWRRDAVTSQE